MKHLSIINLKLVIFPLNKQQIALGITKFIFFFTEMINCVCHKMVGLVIFLKLWRPLFSHFKSHVYKYTVSTRQRHIGNNTRYILRSQRHIMMMTQPLSYYVTGVSMVTFSAVAL